MGEFRGDATKEKCIAYLRKALDGDDAGQYSVSVIEDDFVKLKAENEAWKRAGEDAVKQLGSIVGLMGITALLTEDKPTKTVLVFEGEEHELTGEDE